MEGSCFPPPLWVSSTCAGNRALLPWQNTLPYLWTSTISLTLRHRSIWLQYRGAYLVPRSYVQASRRNGGLGFSICAFSHCLSQRDCFYGRQTNAIPREVNVHPPKPSIIINTRVDKLLGDHPWDQTVRFDGSLSRGSSRFKGPPSKEVDRLWEELVPRKSRVPLLRMTVLTVTQNE